MKFFTKKGFLFRFPAISLQNSSKYSFVVKFIHEMYVWKPNINPTNINAGAHNRIKMIAKG